jgi:hypothetical protein
VKTDNGSLVQRTSEDTTSISTDAYEKYREQTRQKALFFTARMVDYLCYNQSLFPEYLTNVQNQMWSDTNVFPSNNFEISSGNDRRSRNYKRGINGELYG